MINAKDKILCDIFKLLSEATVVEQRKLEETEEEYRCPYNVCGLNGSCKVDNKNIKADYSFTRFKKGSILVDGKVSFNDFRNERHYAIVFMLFDDIDKDPIASVATETKQNSDGLYLERCVFLCNNKKGIFYEKTYLNNKDIVTEKIAYLDKNIKSYCLLDLLVGSNLNPLVIEHVDGNCYAVYKDAKMDGSGVVNRTNLRLEEMLDEINDGVALSLKR